MAEHQPERNRAKTAEKVGVILVHGIGEQRRFEHLEGETRKIVDAIIAKYGTRRRDVTPTLTTGTNDPYLGQQASWTSGREAPLHILVELSDRIVDIAFHEVWWADINEASTIGKQIRFWAWGLSLAGIATHNQPFLPGASNTRPPANANALSYWDRIRMGYVSALFGFSAFSVALINVILKQFNFSSLPLTATIVNYLSAVKLYSQNFRAGGGPMDDPDDPPRAAIRRRMIRVMIDVAVANYDRWYILAHSLGSVVAWNGLMEIEQALPNYLDQKCWSDRATQPLHGTSPTVFNINAMMPDRPVWLGRHEVIARDAFFKNFRGVLTYGSPLERFCGLWSAMVPINQQEDPFQEPAEWVNVYDPTDPVGTWIEDFDPRPQPPPRPGHTKLKPQNFPCRASPILLFSHLCYLTASRLGSLRGVNDPGHLLVNHVADWLIEGGSLGQRIDGAPKTKKTFWMPRSATGRETHRLSIGRVIWRFIQAGLVGLVLTVLTVLSAKYVIGPALTWLMKILFPLLMSVLNSIHLSSIADRLSALAAGLSALLSQISSWLQAASELLNDWSISPYISSFVVNSILAWVLTAIVVFFASLFNNRRSTNDREALRARSEIQSQLPEE
ncbi:MAG TPA: hypothetical protein VE396_06650 [Xanthobacteraceae bacterium]|nr:hypothetical protein [Xanthobacteraceae bacterium]